MSDTARAAVVAEALEMIEPDTTIGLGSGRAVFALVDAIGKRWPNGAPLRAVAASNATSDLITKAGIELVDLSDVNHLDVAFDGADEVDPQLNLIKGGGAAHLREKLVIAVARRVVIMVESHKLVDRLGESRSLPVEIVRFGWQTTVHRLEGLSPEVTLRVKDNEPVVTDGGNYIADIVIPQQSELRRFANDVKLTLGVVEHGVFYQRASEVIVGYEDGNTKRLTRHTD